MSIDIPTKKSVCFDSIPLSTPDLISFHHNPERDAYYRDLACKKSLEMERLLKMTESDIILKRQALLKYNSAAFDFAQFLFNTIDPNLIRTNKIYTIWSIDLTTYHSPLPDTNMRTLYWAGWDKETKLQHDPSEYSDSVMIAKLIQGQYLHKSLMGKIEGWNAINDLKHNGALPVWEYLNKLYKSTGLKFIAVYKRTDKNRIRVDVLKDSKMFKEYK